MSTPQETTRAKLDSAFIKTVAISSMAKGFTRDSIRTIVGKHYDEKVIDELLLEIKQLDEKLKLAVQLGHDAESLWGIQVPEDLIPVFNTLKTKAHSEDHTHKGVAPAAAAPKDKVGSS